MKEKDIPKEIKKHIEAIKRQPHFDKRGTPYYSRGSNKTGCFVIHGFDETAYIMSELVEQLEGRGYPVYSVTLPKMGCGIKAFGKSRYEEWVSWCYDNYLLFFEEVGNVSIIGFSTGATIALRLYSLLKNAYCPVSLVLLSPALYFSIPYMPISIEIFLMSIFNRLVPFPRKPHNRHIIFFDPIAREKYDSGYRHSSTRAIIELFKLAKIVRKEKEPINIPLFVIRARRDNVVCTYGAKWAFRRRVHPDSGIITLKKSGHPVMVDTEKEKVFQLIVDFLRVK